MRIIAGRYKGKRLIAPKKLPVRPTTDMAKEALFNILNNRYHFEDLKVLDLFSGTGNISFEFASRGVETITAVDENANCTRFINRTAKELDFAITVIKNDVYRHLKNETSTWDIIFADPPYHLKTNQFMELVDLVFENNILENEGVLIVEHSDQTDLSESPKFSESRKYGSSVFSFFVSD